MLRTKSDLSILRADLEVHQRHQFALKYLPQRLSRRPTGQPSQTMPYRAQFSQKDDTTHDATHPA